MNGHIRKFEVDAALASGGEIKHALTAASGILRIPDTFCVFPYSSADVAKFEDELHGYMCSDITHEPARYNFVIWYSEESKEQLRSQISRIVDNQNVINYTIDETVHIEQKVIDELRIKMSEEEDVPLTALTGVIELNSEAWAKSIEENYGIKVKVEEDEQDDN